MASSLQRGLVMNAMRIRVGSLVWVAVLAALGGCSFTFSRYVDGPLAGYIEQPLPKLRGPIARELSFEWVRFNTAGGYSGLVVNDRAIPKVRTLSDKVGYRIAQLLEMNREYSDRATAEALALFNEHGGRLGAAAPPEHLRGGGALQTLQVAGLALISADYDSLRRWIETRSGAIGRGAPPGSRLRIVMLQFMDGQPFRLDSRTRVASLMILERDGERSIAVLEGSDVQICINSCDLFPRKPTSSLLDARRASPEVREKVLFPDGLKARNAEGFDNVAGVYQYILLHHGLSRLARQRDQAASNKRRGRRGST